MKNSFWGREVVLAQEIAFSVSMGSVAVLSRGNPALFFPQVLWAFAALLSFNLLFHLLLRRSRDWLVPLASIAVNTVLISVVLAYSGGSESYFWPMYLLPIFTACLHLEARHTSFALASSVAFLAYFYFDTMIYGPAWLLLTFAVKAGVLALSTGVTAQIALRERKARLDLSSTRQELDRLSCAIAETDTGGGRATSRRRLLEGLIYDVHSQLISIQGSSEVLLDQVVESSELRSDIERIAASTRALRQLTSDLVDLTRSSDGHLTEVSLEKLLARVTGLLDYKLKHRDLTLALEIPSHLPKLRQDVPHLQLALLDLMLWVMDHTAPGGRIQLKAARSGGGGVDLTVALAPRAEGQAATTLSVHANVLGRHSVDVRAHEVGDGLELRLLFRVREVERERA